MILENINYLGLSWQAWVSIVGFVILFVILILEKVEKALIAILIASLLVMLQVFYDGNGTSSQIIAGEYIYKNLDIFAFIIGMMIISGIVKDTGFFNFLAYWLVKKVKGHPILIFLILSYLAFFMTVLISNIPTIIILAPIVLLITKSLDLPPIPYIIGIITFANLGGAVTPISDPTTYYQATTLGFTFWEVLSNTGFIMFTVSIISAIYLYLLFRKKFKSARIDIKKINEIEPIKFITSKKQVVLSVSIMIITILFIVFKEFIYFKTGIRLENGGIALFGAFLLVLLMKNDIHHILKSKVDYATLFFFAGLFVIVGALEHNGVIHKLADFLVHITQGNEISMLGMITVGSAILSVFVDNIPYNIAMVSTLEQFRDMGTFAVSAWYALAWGLNSCTSIGGAGSPIGAACNVIALGQAERSGVLIAFGKYLLYMVPLVFINSLTAFGILYLKYLF